MSLTCSSQQSPQRVAITRQQRVPPMMPAIDNNLHARAPDAIDHCAASSKNPAIEYLILAAFRERGVLCVETHYVGGSTRSQDACPRP
jgi:hypothetical protein